MWFLRRSMAPITRCLVNTKSLVNQPLRRAFGSDYKFNNANNYLLIIGGTMTALAGVCFVSLLNEAAIPPHEPAADRLLRVFEEGHGVKLFGNNAIMVDRKDLLDSLGKLLQPHESKHYVVIMGENGTGKTTAVKQALCALKSPKGFVYFNCPISVSAFSVQLANLVEFRGQLDISGGAKRRTESTTNEEKVSDLMDEPLATFTMLMQPLTDAAAKFKAIWATNGSCHRLR